VEESLYMNDTMINNRTDCPGGRPVNTTLWGTHTIMVERTTYPRGGQPVMTRLNVQLLR
jgi:hypothetical protein